MEFFKIAASVAFEVKLAAVHSKNINEEETVKFNRIAAIIIHP